MPAKTSDARAPRRRLTPEQRIPEILDAAIKLFASRGFSATRMDDIAAHAGLSKGGLYNHFASKEDIFRALLDSHSASKRVKLPHPDESEAITVDWLLQHLVDPVYDAFAQEDGLHLIRLMLNEGSRFPEFVAYWHEVISSPFIAALDGAVAQGVAQGLLRECAMTRTPALIVAPALMFLHERLLYGRNNPPHIKIDHQQSHRDLLRENLTP